MSLYKKIQDKFDGNDLTINRFKECYRYISDIISDCKPYKINSKKHFFYHLEESPEFTSKEIKIACCVWNRHRQIEDVSVSFCEKEKSLIVKKRNLLYRCFIGLFIDFTSLDDIIREEIQEFEDKNK